MKRSDHFRVPFLHIFGIVIIIAGFFLLWSAYNGSEQKKPGLTEDNSSAEEEDDIGSCYSDIRERSGSAKRIGTAIIGGLMVLGAVPVFYVPYTSAIFKFRRSKKEDADKRKSDEDESESENAEETEDEFGFTEKIVIKRNDELIKNILESLENKNE